MKHQHEDDENMNCEAGNSTQNTVFFLRAIVRFHLSSHYSIPTTVHYCGSEILAGYDYAKCGIHRSEKNENTTARIVSESEKKRLALSEVKNEICELPTIENYRLLERNNGNNNHGTRRHRINKSWFFSFRLSLKSFGWKGMRKAKETFFSP